MRDIMSLQEVSIEDLRVVNVSFKDRLFGATSSKGNQLKWVKGNLYVKLNLLGYEGDAEVLATHLLRYSNLKPGVDFVEYFSCMIVEDGKMLGEGCYSYDFKPTGLGLITAGKLLKRFGVSFGIGKDDFLDFMSDFMDYGAVRSYLDRILCLDSIIRNDDRHFNNISFLQDKEGNLYTAPIYDNGGGCLSDCLSYPLERDFNLNYNSVLAKPFDISFKDQLGVCDRLLINRSGFFNSLSGIKSDTLKRAVQVIEVGLEEMKGIAWEEI